MIQVVRQACTGCGRTLKIKIDQIPDEDVQIVCPKCEAEVLVRVATIQAAFAGATDGGTPVNGAGPDAPERPTHSSGSAPRPRPAAPPPEQEDELSAGFGATDLTDALMRRGVAERTPIENSEPSISGQRIIPRNSPRTTPPGGRRGFELPIRLPVRLPEGVPPWAAIAGAAGALVLAVGAIVLLVRFLGGGGETASLPAIGAQVDATIAQIRAEYPDPGGEAPELFRDGMSLLRGDSSREHVEADVLFRRALAAAPNHPEPLAALALNSLFIPRSDRKGIGLVQASQWADHVQRAMPDSVLGGTARAALLASVDRAEDARALAARQTETHAQSALAWFVQGWILEGIAPGESAESYRKALALDPGFRIAATGLARVELARGRIAEADAALRTRRNGGETSGAAERVAAGIALAIGDRTSALGALESAVSLEPKDVEARLAWGWQLAGAGKSTAAAGQANHVLATDRPAEDATESQAAEARMLLAEALRRQGKAAEALPHAEAAARTVRDREMGLYLLGLVRLSAGRADQAANALREAAQRAPKRIEIQLALGQAHAAINRYEDALAAYQAAAAIDPADPLVHIGLADIYAENQLPSRALEEWSRMVRARPLDPVTRAVDPRFPRPAPDALAAVKRLRRIEAGDPNRDGRYRVYEGGILAEAGRMTDAFRSFAAARGVDSAEGAFMAGWYLAANRPKDALRLTARPETAAERATRGWALKAARSPGADAMFRAALQLDPAEPHAHLGTAQGLVARGQRKNAGAHLQAARSRLGDIPAVVKTAVEAGL